MIDSGTRPGTPELRELVQEASRALACLDANRLEELAISCRALNRGPVPWDYGKRIELARQAQDAAADMAVFARVLEATRANLKVMNRLREMRTGRLEYREQPERARGIAAGTGSGNGND